jgi:hypothetical protein
MEQNIPLEPITVFLEINFLARVLPMISIFTDIEAAL